MHDVDFLALLVHTGQVPAPRAKEWVPLLRKGAALDEMLMAQLGWSAEQIDKLRRTRCGEVPEIPGFEILANIGTGGTANVFRVREKSTRRLVALKVLKPEATRDDSVRKAFIAEARVLQKLEHPGLVGCEGIARSGNTFFSRLELIDGKTLLEELDAGRVFTEDEALGLCLEVAEVLQYLEEQSLVHRDVKPGNIMLTAAGRVKLIDLGFAGEKHGEASADSAVGTVAYLSPEQARGGAAADCRSDIYSLGLSLFHIVVGRLPFESSDDRELLRMQIMDSLSSPELKGRGISPHLHYFIEKMVAKEADDRYQCWAELIEDIRSQIAGREDLDFEKQVRSERRWRGR